MEIAAVGVAVVGWLVSHWLAIRAQRKTFITQIRNDARKYIGEALRAYQDWCSTVATRLWSLELPLLEGVPPWPEERWLQIGRELTDLFWSQATTRWQFAIEESEILFPQLKRPREQLGDRHRDISDGLSALLSSIWTATDRKQGIQNAKALAERIREQQALIEYLHVYLQNLALGQIVGRRRPVPGPRDVTLLRLNAKGSNLEFGPGEPIGRVALAWRRIRHGRFRAILEGDLPDQRALLGRMKQVTQGQPLPASDWWIQGEGQRMAVQVLDARSGRGLWLVANTPDAILSGFAAWAKSLQPQPRAPDPPALGPV